MATTAVGGYQSTYVFRGNSIYDPDYTGVGKQPYGYDQQTAVYGNGRYYVYGSKIEIFPHYAKITEGSNDNLRGVRWVAFPWTQPTVGYNEYEDITAQIRPYKAIAMNDASDCHQSMKLYQSTKKMLRIGEPDQVEAGAAYNADPTLPWYWIVRADTADVAGEFALCMDVRITYYCKITKQAEVDDS